MTTSFFMSYSRDEVTFVDSLVSALKEHKVPVWVDLHNLEIGHKWSDQIDTALQNSTSVILVVSKGSLKSKYVRDECYLALQGHKRIVLVIFEGCDGFYLTEVEKQKLQLEEQIKEQTKIDDLNKHYRDWEWVDFRQTFQKAVDKLIKLLRDVPTTPSTRPNSQAIMPPIPKLFSIITTILDGYLILGNCISGILLTLFGVSLLSQARTIPLLPRLTLVVIGGVLGLFPLFLVAKHRWSLFFSHYIIRRQFKNNAINTSVPIMVIFTTLLLVVSLLVFTFSYGLQPSLAAILIILISITFPVLSIVLMILIRFPDMYRWSSESGVQLANNIELSTLLVIIVSLTVYIVAFVLIGATASPLPIGLPILLVLVRLWIRNHPKTGPNFRQLNICIDFVLADGYIAHELAAELRRYRHRIVRSNDANVILVLISQYRRKTDIVKTLSKNQLCIPIWIEKPSANLISEDTIHELQSLDLRSNIEKRIKQLAFLIHGVILPTDLVSGDSDKFLKKKTIMAQLGVIPFRTRIIFPRPVSWSLNIINFAIGTLIVFPLVIYLYLFSFGPPNLYGTNNPLLTIGGLILYPFLTYWGITNFADMKQALQKRSVSYEYFRKQLQRLAVVYFFGGYTFLLLIVVTLLLSFGTGSKYWLVSDNKRYEHLKFDDPLNVTS